MDALHTPAVMAEAQRQLMETQSGPLTGGATIGAFFPYKLGATPEEQRDVLASAEASLPTLSPFQRKQYERTIEHLKDDNSANLQLVLIPARGNATRESVEDQSKIFIPPDTPESLPQSLAAVCLEYPLSRGSVHIKSADVNAHPVLDPGFLSHPADLAVLAAGMKVLSKIAETAPMKDKIAKRIFPSPGVDLKDTQQAKEAVQNWVVSEYHPCGSCAMGAAVDSRLRVYGAESLRVVDASVFPNHVSGNIQSSVYMVAEKASDMIKEDWGLLS